MNGTFIKTKTDSKIMLKGIFKSSLFLLGFLSIFLITSSAFAQQVVFFEFQGFVQPGLTDTLVMSPIDNDAFGLEIQVVGMNISSSPSTTGNFGILIFDSSGNIVSVLSSSQITFSAGPSLFEVNFTLPLPIILTPLTSNRYAFYINHTEQKNFQGIVAGAVNRQRVNSAGITDNYIGTPTVETASFANYVLYGSFAPSQDSISTSSFTSAFGGEGYLITNSLTFDSDCSSSFNADLTHSFTLFNGSANTTQTFVATSELIQPTSNQFSNTTIIDWSDETDRSVVLSFLNPADESQYVGGQTVESRCGGTLSNNQTLVSSICSLSITCEKQVIIAVSIFDTLNETVTDAPEVKALQILDIFLTPFSIFTLLMLSIATIITAEIKDVTGNATMVFGISIFIFTILYVILGVYPIEIGIAIAVVVAYLVSRQGLAMISGRGGN